ncbi:MULTISPECIES: hypothetical protein [Klebsiella]|jgi:hypothetical protein|uniref:Uncharacterized protein n=1 Tax=Klebsiella electrica TaxID=1259973 RepID=A0AAJ5UGV2_9ENTR|nr:hypothetical protein [Klebsiella electrica]MXF49550.1 hypothetical protein [Raoultella sp. Lac2]MXF98593.1 hypothetical protein [Raoultella sp. Lac1]PJR64777.1 hypothetical protein CWM52_08985 [Raoultella sp. T31]BBV76434.1 hypothetical protein STW0522RAO56_24880 [Raoultella planticola]QDI08552.1 hypothetical protein electrica_02432 [Klebsiella electrica]
MNDPLTMSFAVRLCSADMSCGFISVSPVLDNRAELIQQRLNWYHQWLHSLCSHLQKETPIPQDIFSLLLLQAVELTAADMLSDAIALAPVLYDRDSRIIESVTSYFSWLQACTLPDPENNELTQPENLSPE